MRLLGVTLVAVVVSGLTVGVRPADAQSKEARGRVTAVSDSSFAVKAGDQDLTFAVDANTKIEAKGAGRQTRQIREAGGSGIKITEFIKAGGAVLVNYRETNGRNVAIWVRPIASTGSGGGSTTQAASSTSQAAKMASGKVKSVTPSALTLTRDGKDLTFDVDGSTTVSAPGAGRAARAAGGRIPITDLVGNGDTVSVVYRNTGATMNASQVRIQVKAH